MKVSYRRTGGFAGMVMSFETDTDSLPADDSSELRDLVRAADFFALPATIESAAPGADQFQYRLMVESEGRQHTVEVGDAAIPETLLPLVNKLGVLLRSTRNT